MISSQTVVGAVCLHPALTFSVPPSPPTYHTDAIYSCQLHTSADSPWPLPHFYTWHRARLDANCLNVLALKQSLCWSNMLPVLLQFHTLQSFKKRRRVLSWLSSSSLIELSQTGVCYKVVMFQRTAGIIIVLE